LVGYKISILLARLEGHTPRTANLGGALDAPVLALHLQLVFFIKTSFSMTLILELTLILSY
jgi:hypothetical protein